MGELSKEEVESIKGFLKSCKQEGSSLIVYPWLAHLLRKNGITEDFTELKQIPTS